MQVKIKRLDKNVPLPEYKTAGAVAFDLQLREEVTIAPGETKLCPTGLVICVPEGHALLLAPRSSNAKKGIMFGNNIGIVDQDYCGPNDELFLALHNVGKVAYTVELGERIGQGMFVPVTHVVFEEVEELEAPNRGGFGSTG
jgi:dUTP pyrophosphatase